MLIGVVAGPVGMLLGGSMGLLTGGVIDLDTDERDDSVLSSFVRHIQPGETAVLAHVNEQSDEVVDNAMAGLGGSVLRQGAAEVEAELAAAEEARRKAEHEARMELRQERQAQKKEDRPQARRAEGEVPQAREGRGFKLTQNPAYRRRAAKGTAPTAWVPRRAARRQRAPEEGPMSLSSRARATASLRV